MVMIFKMDSGDEVHRYYKSIAVIFKGKRKVLSTASVNGGYRDDLGAVFNHDIKPGEGMACELKAPTYEEHLNIIAGELGFNPDYTGGMGTAASMENVSLVVERYDGLSVTAIVTGGVEVNGGRAGDPASYDETKERGECKEGSGTINIILEINADLTPGALTGALLTCTEAKCAALQELMASSKYSTGLATGTGTDGTILISNAASPISLTNAGKHAKLGELIGLAVKKAVKEALYKQTGLDSHYQKSILRRFERYGLNEESLWQRYCRIVLSGCKEKPEFIHNLHVLDRNALLVTLSSLYLHLLDQYEWELLQEEEVKEVAHVILKEIMKILNLEVEVLNPTGDEHFPNYLIGCFAEVMARAAGKE